MKTPSLLKHIANRTQNSIQLAYRDNILLETAQKIGDGTVTKPRDNPVLDFLKDAEKKFSGFRQDVTTSSLLVIVWDDFIYEPISSLINQSSGLLTENTYARTNQNMPQTYPNIDSIIVIRHLHYFIKGSKEEPLDDRLSAMDFGGDKAFPNVLFENKTARPIPKFLASTMRALPYDDPSLTMMAEYNPQDTIFWL